MIDILEVTNHVQMGKVCKMEWGRLVKMDWEERNAATVPKGSVAAGRRTLILTRIVELAKNESQRTTPRRFKLLRMNFGERFWRGIRITN